MQAYELSPGEQQLEQLRTVGQQNYTHRDKRQQEGEAVNYVKKKKKKKRTAAHTRLSRSYNGSPPRQRWHDQPPHDHHIVLPQKQHATTITHPPNGAGAPLPSLENKRSLPPLTHTHLRDPHANGGQCVGHAHVRRCRGPKGVLEHLEQDVVHVARDAAGTGINVPLFSNKTERRRR